MLRLGLDLVFM